MPNAENQPLTGVSETLLITLYLRAEESQRPDGLIKDKTAVELVRRITDSGLYDFNRIKLLHMSEANRLVIILRNRQFDRITLDFLKRHPESVVVHIGCGFDTRFERTDNGQVEWYDLDLPEVIAERRRIFGEERGCHHLLGCSVLDESWIAAVKAHFPRPFLFVAEGVMMYLREAQNKALVRLLVNNFPGAELVFDAYSPVHKIVSNFQTAGFGLHIEWGLWRGRELERWADGIQLLEEWGFMDDPDARLSRLRRLRRFENLFRTMRIYHFQSLN